jgi:hypothetical protein
MIAFNSYDAQMYVFGKGPTQLTAQISDNTIQSGDSILVTGAINDISSGTMDHDRSARFPNGVAAVSDASQEAWMEYVYMQQSKPNNVTGVPVTISVMDANGNYRTIGTAVSNEAGSYAFSWTPDIPGLYTVYSTFEGSASYYPSNAATFFNVNPPPETAATEAPITAQPPTEMYFALSTAAIIVAIAIVGAVLLFALKKRQ